MSKSPRSPKLLKGGIVLTDSSSGAVLRVIAPHHSQHLLTPSLQVQWYGPQQGGRSAEQMPIEWSGVFDRMSSLILGRTAA